MISIQFKLTRKVFFWEGWRTYLWYANAHQIELNWFRFEYLSIICHKLCNNMTSDAITLALSVSLSLNTWLLTDYGLYLGRKIDVNSFYKFEKSRTPKMGNKSRLAIGIDVSQQRENLSQFEFMMEKIEAKFMFMNRWQSYRMASNGIDNDRTSQSQHFVRSFVCFVVKLNSACWKNGKWRKVLDGPLP